MASTASRDQGLARIGSTTRWMAAGVFVVGGVLSAAVAKSLPGHSGHPTSANVSTSTGASSGSATGGGSSSSSAAVAPSATDPSAGSSSSLTAPPQAPQPVYNPPVVNSGGS